MHIQNELCAYWLKANVFLLLHSHRWWWIYLWIPNVDLRQKIKTIFIFVHSYSLNWFSLFCCCFCSCYCGFAEILYFSAYLCSILALVSIYSRFKLRCSNGRIDWIHKGRIDADRLQIHFFMPRFISKLIYKCLSEVWGFFIPYISAPFFNRTYAAEKEFEVKRCFIFLSSSPIVHYNGS